MRIAIIGSGPAGLIAAKHCQSSFEDLKCLHVYERLSCLGGVWCTDRQHSVVYDNLRTNLPKEVMEFEGFNYQNGHLPSSFVTPEVVTEYLLAFVDNFQLQKYIKFETCVTNVSRSDEEWIVTSCYLPTLQLHTEKYDAIFVCNGHYSIPEVPKFPGLEVFKKNKPDDVLIHTIKYRSPLHYKGKNVLVIGAGPSAQDISIDVASEAQLVYISHHAKDLLSVKFPDNIVHKPDIEYFTENGAVFTDGSSCHIDQVLLATGYRYNLDFLDDSCGVWVEEYGYVTPLYKQLINISQPTMAFIGLPFRTLIFPLFEIQVKCMIKILSGKIRLPDRAEMYKDRRTEEENRKLKGIPKRKYHNLANRVRQYMNELYELGKLEPLEEVIFGIYEKTMALRKIDLIDYRNYKFKIKDSKNFEVIYVGKTQ